MDDPSHQTDVLICGSGSAGLMAALWLAKYKIPFRILERRDGPLRTGQADGVQCRTVEIFESFGLADQLLREAYHVLELAFWGPDEHVALDEKGGGGGIKRSHYAPDTEPGLSHLPHVILNQARMNDLITGEMHRCGGPQIDYGLEVKGVQVDKASLGDPEAYPVTVTASRAGTEETFRAKYVLVSLPVLRKSRETTHDTDSRNASFTTRAATALTRPSASPSASPCSATLPTRPGV